MTSEQHWDKAHTDSVQSAWISHPEVVAEIQQRQTGDRDRFWLDWLFEERLKEPVERLLSIGCGAGEHERIIAEKGWARRIDAFDASPAGIGKARAEARSRGLSQIDFRVDTFATFAAEGPDEPIYDAVLFAGSLHHVRDLEGVLSRVRRCLKRDGAVLLNEYVGPTYGIYPQERVDLINRVVAPLPARMKRAPGIQWANQTIDQVMRKDPSEGVRSGILLEVFEMYFDFELKRDFGGGLLHPLFDLLDADALSDGSAEAESIVAQLIETEDRLMQRGELPSDMCLAIGRHKSWSR